MPPGYILLLALPLVTSLAFDFGSCPHRAVQANFSVEQFLGKWYEIRSLSSGHEEGRCGSADIAWRGDDSPPYLDVTLTQILDGAYNTKTGLLYVDPEEPAMMEFRYKSSNSMLDNFLPWAPWSVLMTDYTQVAVSYSCIEIMGIFHIEYAWITARERFLSSDVLKVALSVLDEEDIGMTVMSNQMGC